jgi:uncharacterized SAM-binding protein YcdF (DUF218 family)
VIQAFVEILKEVARPTSVIFVTGSIGVGVGLAFWTRTSRIARWYFAALFAFYWIGSAPVAIEPLLKRAQARYAPLASAADARGARTIVVLGAGNATIQAAGQSVNHVTWIATLRLLEAARLYRLLDRPTIMVSGGVTQPQAGARSEGDAMRTTILELGIPADRIVVEAESKTTRDEAVVIARMLSNARAQPIVLVTSATHMPRAIAAFRAAGLDPVPAAAPYASDHSFDRMRWVPNDVALMLFDSLIYDAAATWYYRLRGWGGA